MAASWVILSYNPAIQPNTKTTVITSCVWVFGQDWHGALDLKLNEDEGLQQGRVAHGPDLGFFFGKQKVEKLWFEPCSSC